MAKTAITGITGLVGSHLAVELLKQGHEITALKGKNSDTKLIELLLSESNYNIKQINIIEGTLFDHDALMELVSDAEVVFHCAAKVSFWKKDRDLVFETNVQGTRNLVNAMLRAKTQSMVYLSSIAALGRDEFNTTLPITINNQWNESRYNTAYAESKHLAELEVWRGAEEGINTSVILPGVIIGAGIDKKSSAEILHMARKGNKFYPTGSNGFVTVNDVVKLMLKAWKSQWWNKKILAVSDNMDYLSLLTTFNTAFEKPAPTLALKGILFNCAKVICRMLETLGLPSPAPSQALISTSYKSNYKIEEIEDFTFSGIENEAPSIAALYVKRNSK